MKKILSLLLCALVTLLAQGQTKKCTVCCSDSTKANVIVSKNYEGFILDADSVMLQHAGLKPVKFFWHPSLKDIQKVEGFIREHFDSIKNQELNPDVDYLFFKNYIRQYIGVIDGQENRLIIITFNDMRLQGDFCEKYYAHFKEYIVRMHFQKWGKDFYLIYDINNNCFRRRP